MAFNVYIIVASIFDAEKYEEYIKRIKDVVYAAFEQINLSFVSELYDGVLYLLSIIPTINGADKTKNSRFVIKDSPIPINR